MKTAITLTYRTDLKFSAPDLGSERLTETFESSALSQSLDNEAKAIIIRSMALLDDTYHPENLAVDLEHTADMTFEDQTVEQIPVSLIVSQQQPSKSRIRLGMFEIGEDRQAFGSILAHEMGHMLPEWALRKAGLVNDADVVIPYWSKPIYEGVADWVSAVVTGDTIVGSNGIWFNRDINLYKSLEESRNSVGRMTEIMTHGLETTGLVPKYRAYREWLSLVNEYLGAAVDPYAEGQWIASKLWNLSHGQKDAKRIFDRIIKAGLARTEQHDPEQFLDLIC